MEGVPRISMISVPMKRSADTPNFKPRLKAFISDHYNENPDSYTGEINELESLRASAIHASKDFSGCATLKKYFCQLNFLKSRFPLHEGSPIAVTFSWYDVYSDQVHGWSDIDFEMSCVLFNIGALHTELASTEKRQTSDGIKSACTHYQCAAWAFQHLRHNYQKFFTPDISPDILSIIINVCLGQAQECILEKSLIDNRKSTIQAKVVLQIVEYYQLALKTTDQMLKDSTQYSEKTVKAVKKWRKLIELKVAYYSALANFFRGLQSEDQQKWGERITFYKTATEMLEAAFKLSKNMDKNDPIHETLVFTNDVILGKLKVSEKENEFIYHDKVPELGSIVGDLKGVSLVKGVPLNIDDPEVSGPDIFGRLVPMEAHEASSLYSEEKAKLLRTYGSKIEEKNQALDKFLVAVQLNQLELLTNEMKVPQALVDCCAALSANKDAIKKLSDLMSTLSGLFHDVDGNLNEIHTLLQEQETKEKEYQSIMGKRPPNNMLTELSREEHKHLSSHKAASETNQQLHEVMKRHLANIQILMKPFDEVMKHIPSAADIGVKDEAAISEMQRLAGKVDEMRKQRESLEAQLRESIQNDDITKQLVVKKDEDQSELFRDELKKHEKITQFIDQNLLAQENIIRALTEANSNYAETRKATSDIIGKRNNVIQSLISSYEAYDELMVKCNNGIDFYKKLDESVLKLLQRVRSVCKVQDEEREQVMKTLMKKLPTQPPNIGSGFPGVPAQSTDQYPGASHPKLKDYFQTPAFSAGAATADAGYGVGQTQGRPKLKDYYRGPSSSIAVPAGNSNAHYSTPQGQQMPPSNPYVAPVQPNSVPTADTNIYHQGITQQMQQPQHGNHAPQSQPPAPANTSVYQGQNIISQSQPQAYPSSSYVSQSQPTSGATGMNFGYQSQPHYDPATQQYYPNQSFPQFQANTTYFPTSQGSHQPGSIPTSVTQSINRPISNVPNEYYPSAITNTGASVQQYQANNSYYSPSLQHQSNAVGPSSMSTSGPDNRPGTGYQAATFNTANASTSHTQQYQPSSSYYPGSQGSQQHVTPTVTATASQGMNKPATNFPNEYSQTNVFSASAANTSYGTGQDQLIYNHYAKSLSTPSQPYIYSQGTAGTIPQTQQPPASNAYGPQHQHQPGGYVPQTQPAPSTTGMNQGQQPQSYYDPTTQRYYQNQAPAQQYQTNNPYYSQTQVPQPYGSVAPNASQTTQRVNKPATNFDLLSDMDLSAGSHAIEPLAPVSSCQINSTSNSVGDLRVGSNEANSPMKGNNENIQMESKDDIISSTEDLSRNSSPIKIASNSIKKIKVDPLSDPTALAKFAVEVEKLSNLIESFHKKSLNGPTNLDLKWREVVDIQNAEIVRKGLNISIGRLYRSKNRSPDILPFDFNSVRLPSTKDDYINASFLKELSSSSISFIATQAPLPSTFQDFWHMIWSENIELIVCIASETDLKGHIYWPDVKGKELVFGPFKVILSSRNVKQYYLERIVSITHRDIKQTRVIVHLQFNEWTGNVFPTSPSHLLSFVNEVHSFHVQQRNHTRPVVVHCLSGVGKTGVFCVLSSAIQEIENGKGILDVAQSAGAASTQRKAIMIDKEYLKFTYHCLLYYCQDLLLKRGILSTRLSFDDKTPKKTHTRHPSQDFLQDQLKATKNEMLADTTSIPQKTVSLENHVNKCADNDSPVKNLMDGGSENNRSEGSSRRSSHSSTYSPAIKSKLYADMPANLTNLDPATFRLNEKSKDDDIKSLSREAFESGKGALLDRKIEDPLDPLSSLDPLWTIKK